MAKKRKSKNQFKWSTCISMPESSFSKLNVKVCLYKCRSIHDMIWNFRNWSMYTFIVIASNGKWHIMHPLHKAMSMAFWKTYKELFKYCTYPKYSKSVCCSLTVLNAALQRLLIKYSMYGLIMSEIEADCLYGRCSCGSLDTNQANLGWNYQLDLLTNSWASWEFLQIGYKLVLCMYFIEHFYTVSFLLKPR